MKKMTDLLAFELDRIKYGYLLLIGAIASLQCWAVLQERNHYLKLFQNFQKETRGNDLDFLYEQGPLSFLTVVYSSPYIFSITLGVIVLLLYAGVIWYRDWLGRNSFSYRLLSLPGSRMSVFFSKLLTILFLILGLLAVQLVLMLAGGKLLELLTPEKLFQHVPLRQIFIDSPLFVILPPSPIDFLFHYTLGISGLSVVYLMILLHLSFKWKGLLMDAGIAGGLFLLFTVMSRSPLFQFLYPMEALLFLGGLAIVLFLGSVWGSRILLNQKITV